MRVNNFFNKSLKDANSIIYDIIGQEVNRQSKKLGLIASENFASKAVLEAQGSVLTNKYAEGYPNKRYYSGCEYVDDVEKLALDYITKLFGCKYANVQPHSGSQANQAVFLALLQPGDTIMGQSLDTGGHLSHGAAVNQSGKWFNVINYGVQAGNGLIDFEELYAKAREHKPKLIIAGFSSYPRVIDWSKFRKIADEINAYLLVDIAHIAGLIAGGAYPSPVEYADVITSTTHKTLRGPRGGIILTNREDLIKKINSAVFPGLQGGPLMHVIAAKAVAFSEALEPDFKKYANKVVDNARVLAKILVNRGVDVITRGTDNHIVLITLVKSKVASGRDVEQALERADITCNKNAVPNDPRSPFISSGVRLGTAACTTRGFLEKEFELVGNLIADIIQATIATEGKGDVIVEQRVKEKVAELTSKFPMYV